MSGYLGVRTRTYFHDSTPFGLALAAAWSERPIVNNEYFRADRRTRVCDPSRGSFVMIEGRSGLGPLARRAARALEHVGAVSRITWSQWRLSRLTSAWPRIRPARQRHRSRPLRSPSRRIGGERRRSALRTGKPRRSGRTADRRRTGASESPTRRRGSIVVPSLELGSIDRRPGSHDLIDLDIQGAEADVLASAGDELDNKVRRVHVATRQRKVEAELRVLFRTLGWVLVNDYACGSTSRNPLGRGSHLSMVFKHGQLQIRSSATRSRQAHADVAGPAKQSTVDRHNGAPLDGPRPQDSDVKAWATLCRALIRSRDAEVRRRDPRPFLDGRDEQHRRHDPAAARRRGWRRRLRTRLHTSADDGMMNRRRLVHRRPHQRARQLKCSDFIGSCAPPRRLVDPASQARHSAESAVRGYIRPD